MKPLKIVVIVLIVYAGVVAAFESMIGILQPTVGEVLVITTTASDGVSKDRVLARVESGGQLYVAANHWPRAWYTQARAHPDVEITIDGVRAAYRAIPASEEEEERMHRENDPGLVFRILTGFPPRHFLRLEPRAENAS
jgi:hypothetical protein